ncbi:MAG TPA: NAD(P)H-binding protein, partial [Nannocystis sp.]
MSGAKDRVLVTGGTGKTGGAIARRLTELGLEVRIASRSARGAGQVRFDWADASTHAAALDGVTRVYLVAPGLVDDPAAMMVPFIKRALASEVRRLVLLGSSAISDDAPGLGEVARVLRASAPEWAVLRPSWFMQNFLDPAHAHGQTALADGTIVTSTAGGRVGFVDVADIAEVGARALADERSHDAAHVITGPQALSYAE